MYGLYGMYRYYDGMECLLCKVGMVCMACMFGIVCMVSVVIMFNMYQGSDKGGGVVQRILIGTRHKA